MASSDPNKRPSPLPGQDSAAMPPSSWEKRTGFRFKFSGETYASDSGQIDALPPPELPQARLKPPNSDLDLKAGRPQPAPNGEAATAASVAKDRAKEEKEKERKEREQELAPPVRKWKDSDGGKNWVRMGRRRRGEESRREVRKEEADVLPQSVLDDDGFISRQSVLRCAAAGIWCCRQIWSLWIWALWISALIHIPLDFIYN